MADSRLHAVFERQSDVRGALQRLSEAGIAPADIEVRSSIPLAHDIVPGGAKLTSRVTLFAPLGALVGGTAGVLLASLTAPAANLPTGGMPIVSLPPYAVITFEGLALGAILFTVATVFYECRLPGLGYRTGPLDEHIAAGSIVVAAVADEGSSAEWASAAIATELETAS